jgi:hypothetical protein
MASPTETCRVRVGFENQAAYRAFRQAQERLLEIVAERSWDGEVKEVLECLEQAADGLTLTGARPQAQRQDGLEGQA